jgi:hypothetical protein
LVQLYVAHSILFEQDLIGPTAAHKKHFASCIRLYAGKIYCHMNMTIPVDTVLRKMNYPPHNRRFNDAVPLDVGRFALAAKRIETNDRRGWQEW